MEKKKYNHSDIKIFRPNGKLKKVVKIKDAMEASDQRFKARKSTFGAGSPKVVHDTNKRLAQMAREGYFDER